MVLLENKGIPENTIKKVLERLKVLFEDTDKFDETIDGINFWCTGDKEGTVYIRSKDDGYAVIEKIDVQEADENDLIEGIVYQLDNTVEQD